MRGKGKVLLTLVVAVVFTVGLGSTVNAGVIEGRQYLFNNGSPTYSGILAANVEFQAVVAVDPGNQEANIFYAVTRIMAFGLESGNGAAFETLRDVYEAFGITRSTADDLNDSPVDMPPDVNGYYVPPTTLPDGDGLRDFLAGPFLSLLTDAVGNLDTISPGFETVLSAQETGGDAVTVDYNDVLILKSMLLSTKALIEFLTAYDQNSLDIRNLVVLSNAGMLQLQRDILDRYESILALRTGDGAAHLLNVWDSLNRGIDAYRDAYDFIKGRWDAGDLREEHLFSFTSQDDIEANGDLVSEMTKVQLSIEGNSTVDFTSSEESISLYDQQAPWNGLSLYIYRESGEISGAGLHGSWDFLTGAPVLESYSLNGSDFTVNISDTGSTCTAVLSGVIDEIQQSGSFWSSLTGHINTSNCSGKSYIAANGSYNISKEGQLVNLNRFFGTNSQPALDIRAVLPEFAPNSSVVAGSFPPVDDASPVLNGLLPYLSTNADLTEELELEASGYATIRQDTKVIDGIFSDWSSDDPVFHDGSGDGCDSTGSEDVIDVYLAKDAQNLYLAVTFPTDGQGLADYFSYSMALRGSMDSWNDDIIVYISTSDGGSTWSVDVYGRYFTPINNYDSGYAADGNGFIEARIPLTDIYTALSSFSGTYLTDSSLGCDHNSPNIRLDTGELTGTISIPAAASTGSGKIFLSVYDAPGHNNGNLLGSTYLEPPAQNYTISGLTISPDNVYLSAWWDRDNNGVATEEDYWWDTAVVVTASTTTLNIDLQSVLIGDHLQDTLAVLRVLAGMNPLGLESVPDANTNGKIDMADALGRLQQARELNQE